MLRTLTIRDMVLIETAELAFEPGLNVLTGETGAGKSILLDSLGFVLGWRGRADLVRAGAEQGEVEAGAGPERHGLAAEQPAERALARPQVQPGVAGVAQEAGMEPGDGLGAALEHLDEPAVEEDQPARDPRLAVAQMRGADDAEDRVESGPGRRATDIDDPFQHGPCLVPALGRRVAFRECLPRRNLDPER